MNDTRFSHDVSLDGTTRDFPHGHPTRDPQAVPSESSHGEASNIPSDPTVDQETAELRYIGDGMQSAASRMAEWIRNVGSKVHGRNLPYEVYMAALEAEDYVAQWTDARTGYATQERA